MPHPTEAILIRLCMSCENGATEAHRDAVAAAVSAAGVKADVALQPCLGACARPVSVSFQGAGRAVYVFAGVDLAADLDSICDTARAYTEAPGGWIEDARKCGRLRFCLQARVPAAGDPGT